MALIPLGALRRRPTEQEMVALELVSGLLIIIGVLAFVFLFYSILTNDDIREATQGPEIPGIGLNVDLVQPEGEDPYFAMRPVDRGPSDAAGVQDGDHLVSIDGNDITGMDPAQVEALIEEDNIELEDDDFQIELGFLRPRGDGFSEQTRVVTKNVAPSLAIAYLKSFGFVVPLAVMGVGVMFFRLGIRLRKFDVVSARWALVAFIWLIIGLIVVAGWAFWVNGKGGIVSDDPFDIKKAVSHATPFLVAIIPLAIAYRWLGGVIDQLFEGEEPLSSRQTRFAWTLLVPTLVVLILVAGRPLEQTFTKSLTDDQFGTNRPARYVGFENYQNLLSFKLDTVTCKKDEGSDECARTRNGSIIWDLSSVEDEERAKLRSMSREERQNYTSYSAATTWALPSSDTGIRLLGKDPTFLNAVGHTLKFTFMSVVLELILGLLIALVVNSSFKGRGLMRAAMLVPWAIPTVVSAVLWQTIMRGDQTGILNKLLVDLGILDRPEQWFATTGPWMRSIVAVDVWKTAPFMALLLLAGLQVIPGDLYEAASVDGASKIRQFFTITLPLLRPTIAIALIFRTLDALRVFDVFQVLLDETRPSMATYNYYRLVLSGADGYASAVGVIIFLFIFLFTVVYVRFVGIERE